MHRYIEPREGLPLVPLNDDERAYLKTIYDTRFRLVVSAFAIMLVFALFKNPQINFSGKKMKHIPERGRNGRLYKREAYNYEIFGHDLTGIEYYLVTNGGLLLLLNVLGIMTYLKAVNPYRKDLKLGMKEKVGYMIISKSYFPLTNQYYFNFDNPDLMHYEVDADLYNAACEGDTAFLYRAKYSKQVFEKNGRFTLM